MTAPLPFHRSLGLSLFGTLALAAALVAPSAFAADDVEEAAARLQATTVTVRIVPALPKPPVDGAEGAEAPVAEPPAGPQRVTVCSGASLGGGLVVTHFDSSAQGRIRLTLPGGAQAEGRLKVYDQHTGLALLETTQKDLPALAAPPEGETLRVGGTVLSAAAWGTEKPVVAVGHIGGLDRALPGTSLPPLLQCGLRATETSAGGPVVDGRGRLVGIAVAADPAADARGWVYAVPVEHVARLRRAVVEGKVVVIPKVRPQVGLELIGGADAGSVIVNRVAKSGPAEKAGIIVGDRVLAVDGLIVRSVYQVTTPVLQKRPGDKISVLYERGGVQQKAEIQLGGSFAVKEQDPSDTIQLVDLGRVKIDRAPDGRIGINRPQFRDLGLPGEPPPAGATNKTDVETQLFERALERYGKLILKLQEQIKERDDQRAADSKQIEALKTELERLKGQK